MADKSFIALPNRRIINVSGEDAREFLQGLITNDMELVSENRAVFAALLTPQGKYLHDFFIIENKHEFYIDCEKDRVEDLIERFSRYRLRARVSIQDTGVELTVYALTGKIKTLVDGLSMGEGRTKPFADGIVFEDPRTPALGERAIIPSSMGNDCFEQLGFLELPLSDYDSLRYTLAIPQGSPEIVPEVSFPMEYGFDRLNGVSFSKGCYVGQEVTVRMKNRDLVKKDLVPVRIEGNLNEKENKIYLGDTLAGELRGICGDLGLALIRKEHLDRALTKGSTLQINGSRVYPINYLR